MSVDNFTLEVKARSERGSKGARRLRAQGRIPSVIYGKGVDKTATVCVSDRQFVKLASYARTSQVFTLKSESAELDGRSVIVKEIQQEHLKGNVLHVDFQMLVDNEKVKITVPLEVSGEPVGVKTQGGVLQVATREIDVVALPRDIPSVLHVDVSELQLGHSLHAGDIALAEGVNLAGTPDEVIASVVASRTSALLEAADAEKAEGAGGGEGSAEGSSGDDGEKKEAE